MENLKNPKNGYGELVFIYFIALFLAFIFLMSCGATNITRNNKHVEQAEHYDARNSSEVSSESFSVTLPASILERLDLPAGITIYTYNDSTSTKDSTATEPMITIDYNKEMAVTDSVVSKEKTVVEDVVQETKKTEINKGSGLNMFLVGMVITLSLILALFMWWVLRRF